MSNTLLLWSLAIASLALYLVVRGGLRLVRALAESERRFELAASATGFGLWVWDLRTGRIWATERARELFGLQGDDWTDPDRWRARIHPADLARVNQQFDAALSSGKEYFMEHRICLPGEGTHWIAARGQAERNAEGRPVCLRGVLRDITSTKAAQDESNELRRDLAHAGRVTMLGQLASSLAHELSQPLAAILRNAETAEMILRADAPDVDELRAIVSDIHRDDRRAGEVIERLRALLKRRHLDFQAMTIDGLVKDVSALVRQDAAARHVSLECALAAGLPRIAGDRVHLSQVLINLVINGLDAISAEPGPSRAIRIVARTVGGRDVEMAVSDTGPGIPPEMLGRLFEPFFTTKTGGMGMGLAVSRTIVEAHGGKLWAENNETGGATFRFTIPVIQGGRT